MFLHGNPSEASENCVHAYSLTCSAVCVAWTLTYPLCVLLIMASTVYQVARAYSKEKRAFPIVEVKLYTYQIFRSLAYIHSLGICHRDIKPQVRGFAVYALKNILYVGCARVCKCALHVPSVFVTTTDSFFSPVHSLQPNTTHYLVQQNTNGPMVLTVRVVVYLMCVFFPLGNRVEGYGIVTCVPRQNLLLDTARGVLKLCDFGSAKVLVAGEPNVSYICSRYYRAPELIFGATNYTVAIGGCSAHAPTHAWVTECAKIDIFQWEATTQCPCQQSSWHAGRQAWNQIHLNAQAHSCSAYSRDHVLRIVLCICSFRRNHVIV